MFFAVFAVKSFLAEEFALQSARRKAAEDAKRLIL